ncbi:aldo/keto reductase [Aurantibacter crassamenti]|nr:aldo/keto reductase [Aurantibacter crassamenti]
MTWGSWGKQLSKLEMIQLIEDCFALGISTFDHADIYGGYSTETEFGVAFKESQISRENVQLISKCGIQLLSENRKTKVKHYDYSKKHIIWSVENSLKNLKTDYLDLLLLHRPSPLMNAEVIAESITQLKEEGKIKSVGVSNFTPSQIAMLESYFKVDANQVEFSLTKPSAMNDGSLDDCMINKRWSMAWSPLGSYFRENTEQVVRIKQAMKPMLDKYQVSEDQLLLAWLMKQPAFISPVVGTTSKIRLQKSIEATEVKLELEDWFSLLEASTGHEVA